MKVNKQNIASNPYDKQISGFISLRRSRIKKIKGEMVGPFSPCSCSIKKGTKGKNSHACCLDEKYTFVWQAKQFYITNYRLCCQPRRKTYDLNELFFRMKKLLKYDWLKLHRALRTAKIHPV